jgi:N6-L-threonylcarbamoyladenine synthase
MLILGIETSCDDASVAVVEDGYKLLGMATSSQIDIHKLYGGVVPEIAAREHLESIISTTHQALASASIKLNDVDAIAITSGPGLIGSLLVGVQTAKTFSLALNIPIQPVHHVVGHVYANFITESKMEMSRSLPKYQPIFPMLALVVSGGHTQLMLFEDHLKFSIVGRTIDDAIGEAFDKTAKILNLPYPGGVSVSKRAILGDKNAYKLPRPKTENILDVSFSGLKTALLREAQKAAGGDFTMPSFEVASCLSQKQIDDFCASFEEVALNYVVEKTRLAYLKFSPKSVVIGGGVAGSQRLRTKLNLSLGVDIEYAPPELCTDNGAMIAAAGYWAHKLNEPIEASRIKIEPNKRVFTGI